MIIDYQHALTGEEAYQRINNHLTLLQERYADKISDPSFIWDAACTQMNYRLGFRGYSIHGQITVRDNLVSIEGKLPFMARLFTGKIEERVRRELDLLFSVE